MVRGTLTRSGVLLGLAVLAADQASKWWVLNILHLPERGSIAVLPGLNLTMEMNSGVTFGLLRGFGSGQHLVLALVALVVVVALGAWLRRAERLSVALALGAVAGGAVGNVVDRLHYGEVVDFIHLHAYGWSWYIFNLADSAIVCGVAVLVLDGVLPRRRAILKPEPGGGNPV